MKIKRYAVLDINRGIVNPKRVILAEFDTMKEAEEWQSKLKVYGENALLRFADYPIFDFKGKPPMLKEIEKEIKKNKKGK
jgi:hypothetical protein